ncbi:hypothetical protein NQ166_03645 [Microbacterium sp. zg.Y1090]|nr:MULTISPECIES: hypothetical protein [unclassified Microbacterium]MCR2814073.1 hypothetical protein [Microbacterium sp. zg.Y1084]MCR2817922.1 hypothetical protein [Microbacterium sp. zg.Y1090]MDL5487776.1 hypothetical protein [Microbacterium sp. zg-Y1211]WIM27913.1 hypothetical protein QNO26_12270 [Microbacterium sp. zg-Y1090]
MTEETGHPSQAEGDDPDRPSDAAQDEGATGHPSQAEGEDTDDA